LNAIQLPDGKWISYAQVRKRNDPELWEVIDRNPRALKRYPDTRFGVLPNGKLFLPKPGEQVDPMVRGGSYSLYTRIWAAITPKKGLQPGYCAVVGECYDDTFDPKERDFFLLDEGVTLGDNPSLSLHPDLFEATSALKDIYKLDRIYLDFKNGQFLTEIQKMQWGIVHYPEEDSMSDRQIRKRFPFFESRERICSPIEAPYAGNDEWDFSTVDALFARKRLIIHPSCETWRFGQYRTPHRALAMAVGALMFWDWSEILREQEISDGYESSEMTKGEEEQEEQDEQYLCDVAWMVGDQQTRGLIEEEGLDGYRKAVGLEWAT